MIFSDFAKENYKYFCLFFDYPNFFFLLLYFSGAFLVLLLFTKNIRFSTISTAN